MNQLAALALAALVAPANLGAQIPAKRTIDVRDGDVLMIDGSARIPVVRRHQAQVRAVHSDAEKWLILMMDLTSGTGNPADGVPISLTVTRDLLMKAGLFRTMKLTAGPNRKTR